MHHRAVRPELVIDLKTAKALDRASPQSLLLRAEEVIQQRRGRVTALEPRAQGLLLAASTRCNDGHGAPLEVQFATLTSLS